MDSEIGISDLRSGSEISDPSAGSQMESPISGGSHLISRKSQIRKKYYLVDTHTVDRSSVCVCVFHVLFITPGSDSNAGNAGGNRFAEVAGRYLGIQNREDAK